MNPINTARLVIVVLLAFVAAIIFHAYSGAAAVVLLPGILSLSDLYAGMDYPTDSVTEEPWSEEDELASWIDDDAKQRRRADV